MILSLLEAVVDRLGITPARRQQGSPIKEADTVPQEAVPQEAARALALRSPGWCLWYGTATERWRALSPNSPTRSLIGSRR
ncbi:hypothetical protein [Streptosporangium sp. NPDC000396]|uniref:hypothetical protein n=1 Tax=Streptosporangium sp. NPDC000396 TaxID=3366185 RepID=UPI0036981828